MFQEIQAVFTEELVPTTTQWPLGTVGVIDESGFEKAGTESVGVGRQWCGRLGKTENCQVGVFLVGVTLGGVAALDTQLFLTEDWIADLRRRKKTGVPEKIEFPWPKPTPTSRRPKMTRRLVFPQRRRACRSFCPAWTPMRHLHRLANRSADADSRSSALIF